MNKFIEEIYEQPEALKQTMAYCLYGEGKESLANVCGLWKSGRYDSIVFTGMGSSFFISQAAATMLAHIGISAFAINAGELLHFQYPLLNSRVLLVAISQSGESYEVVNLIRKIDSKITIVALSNEAESTLVKQATVFLLSKAGKEEMTSTKTFISTYLIVYLLSQVLQNKSLEKKAVSEVVEEVERLLRDQEKYVETSLGFLSRSNFVQFIGRGTNYASASQSALMFMEAAKMPSSALLGGEFRHGPLEMVDDNFLGVVFSSSDSSTTTQAVKLVSDLLKYNGRVIFVSDAESGLKSPNLLEIQIQSKESDLFSIPAIIPIQIIVNAYAEARGLTPGSFTHGAKVTSIE